MDASMYGGVCAITQMRKPSPKKTIMESTTTTTTEIDSLDTIRSVEIVTGKTAKSHCYYIPFWAPGVWHFEIESLQMRISESLILWRWMGRLVQN